MILILFSMQASSSRVINGPEWKKLTIDVFTDYHCSNFTKFVTSLAETSLNIVQYIRRYKDRYMK